jgi:hypothetical protein
MRPDLAVPIPGHFRTWLEAQRPEVLPKSPMGEAMGYALTNWAALVRYTEAGFLAIDNNAAERGLRGGALRHDLAKSDGGQGPGVEGVARLSRPSACGCKVGGGIECP